MHRMQPSESILPSIPSPAVPRFAQVQVLAFDIFGTVVDWHDSIVRTLDASAFALAWCAGYVPTMARVMRGEQGWAFIDDLHRGILDTFLPRFGLGHPQGMSDLTGNDRRRLEKLLGIGNGYVLIKKPRFLRRSGQPGRCRFEPTMLIKRLTKNGAITGN